MGVGELAGVPVIDGVAGAVDVDVPIGVLDEEDVMEGEAPDESVAVGVGPEELVNVLLVVGVPLLEDVGVPEGVPVADAELVPDVEAVLEVKEITITLMLVSVKSEVSKSSRSAAYVRSLS